MSKELKEINDLFQDFIDTKNISRLSDLANILEGEYDPDPEYVVLSTAHEVKETFVFPSNEHGNITRLSEITGLAQRWDKTDDYLDTDKVLKALNEVTGHEYVFVKKIYEDILNKQLLYKRNDV